MLQTAFVKWWYWYISGNTLFKSKFEFRIYRFEWPQSNSRGEALLEKRVKFEKGRTKLNDCDNNNFSKQLKSALSFFPLENWSPQIVRKLDNQTPLLPHSFSHPHNKFSEKFKKLPIKISFELSLWTCRFEWPQYKSGQEAFPHKTKNGSSLPFQ